MNDFLKNGEDLVLFHDQTLATLGLDLGTGVLVEQNAVTLLDFHFDAVAGRVATALADGDDFALGRTFLGGVRDNDAALFLLFLFQEPHDNAVTQWNHLHSCLLDWTDRVVAGSRSAAVDSLSL